MNRALTTRSRPIPPDFCHTSYACFSFRRSASAIVQLLLWLKRTFAALVPDVQGGTTKPMRDDDVGKSRNRSMPKCPIIALVNHVKGDKAPKRHPTQRGTQSRHSLSDCSYLPCRQTHFFSPRGNSRMYNATYLVLHIYRSQAESQFGEALRNQEMQKRKLLQKEREEGHFGA